MGFVWGDEEGEILIEPDEAVRGAVQTIFDRLAEPGSVRQVAVDAARECSSRRAASLTARPSADLSPDPQRAREPVYAGAYAFGKTRRERYVDEHGNTRQRMRRLPQPTWGS